MTTRQHNVIDLARQHLRERDEVHLQTQTKRSSSYPIGSIVLAEHRGTWRRGPKSKLLPFKKGPLRVVNVRGDKYVLQDLVTHRTSDYHIKDISPFHYDKANDNPLDYALRDEKDSYHMVDYIEKYIGNLKGPRSKFRFKVHWKDTTPSIELYDTIKNTEPFIMFCRNHWNNTIKGLVPKNILIEQNEKSMDIDYTNMSSEDEGPIAEIPSSDEDEEFSNNKRYWRNT